MRKVLSWNARRYDREILYLALPALGAPAAEPTYVLADTAIVGVAMNVLMAVRLFTCGARFVGRRWAVTGTSTPGRVRAS